MSGVVVFLGPSAPREALGEVLNAEFMPPVAQGDIFRAVEGGARAIGVVDGYFDSTRSIWHKEILWAIGEGVAVFGAASMGALRAAELAPFGMRGVGWVFEAFASGRLEDDDEVAIVHAPDALGFRPVSEAMVSVRCTLERAREQSVLDEAAAAAVQQAAKTLYYADRDWPRILHDASAIVGARALAALEAWLPSGRVDIKRQDAIALAQAMNGWLSAGSAPPPPSPYEATALVEGARRLARAGEVPADRCGGLTGLIDEWRLHDPSWAAAEDQALLDALAASRAAASGSAVDEAAMLETIAAFRAARKGESETPLEDWMRVRGLTEARLLAILARQARVRQARSELAGLAAAMLQERALLQTGAPRWAARAEDKARRLEDAGRRGALPPCELDDDQLLAWHETTFGVAPAAGADPRRTDAFMEALRREHQYRRLRAPGGAAEADHGGLAMESAAERRG